MEKVCFITTGATAEFRELIEAVLTPECMMLFKQESFTTLTFQCGATFKDFEQLKLERLQPADIEGLQINAFDFKPALTEDMRKCQAVEGVRQQGLIILHAGAGTVMDAMRLGLSMIVVPNNSLLDNHQDELAKELHSQNYATRATTQKLPNGIRRACAWQAQPWVTPACRLATIVDKAVGYNEDGTPRYSEHHRIIEFVHLETRELLNVDAVP